jgi:hypothetical protein
MAGCCLTPMSCCGLCRRPRLTAKVRRDIERSDAFVSAASIWEIAIKQPIGKSKSNLARCSTRCRKPGSICYRSKVSMLFEPPILVLIIRTHSIECFLRKPCAKR